MGALSDLIVRIGANIDEFEGAMAQVSTTVGAVAAEVETKFAGFDKIGTQLSGLGTSLIAAFAAPAAALGLSVKAFADFDEAMTKSVAIQENVSAEMKQRLSDAAVALSTTLSVSAKDAAASYYFLASAGLSVNDQIGALPIVANFAKAGLVSMNDSAAILTRTQFALGMQSKDTAENLKNMAMISDVLVKADTLALGKTQEFADALTNKGATAMKTYNISLLDGISILAAYSQAGIRGEQAGTYFEMMTRQFTQSVVKHGQAWTDLGVAVYDTQGKLRSPIAILSDLQTAMQGMTDKQRAAELGMLGIQARAQFAILPLLGLKDTVLDLRNKFEDFGGTSERVSKGQMKTFNEQCDLLWNRVTALGITIGQALVPAMESLGQVLNPAFKYVESLVESFKKLSPSMQTTIVGSAALVTSLGLLSGAFLLVGGMALSGFGQAMKGLALLQGAFAAMAPEVIAFATETMAAAVAAVVEFALVTLPAAILAAGSFATALLVDAGAALVAFAASVTTNAGAALATFAVSTLPAATAAVIAFATTSIPAAIAAVTTFATTAIPAAIAGLETLYITTIPNLVTAIGALVAGSLPALIGLLSALGVAALAAGAAFIGWNIGQWALANIPALQKLNDSIGDLLVKVPLLGTAMLKWAGITAITDKATTDFAASTEKLRKYLAAHGVTIDQGTLSLDAYNKKLIQAAQSLNAATDSTSKLHPEVTKANTAVTALGQSTDTYTTKLFKWNDLELKHIITVGKLNDAIEAAKGDLDEFNDKVTLGLDPIEKLDREMGSSIFTMTGMAGGMAALTATLKDMNREGSAAADSLSKAFSTLKVTSSSDLGATAAAAKAAYQTIVSSGVATRGEVEQAWAAMTKAEIAYRTGLGEDVSALQIQLKQYTDAHANASKEISKQWGNLAGDIERDFGSTIRSVFEGDFGLNKLEDLVTKIGADIVSVMFEPAEKAAARFIVNGLKPIFESMGDILTRIPLIGDALGTVFGGGGGVLGTSVGAAGGAAASGAGSAAGSAAGGAAGQAAGGAVGTATSTAGTVAGQAAGMAVSAVVGMVTGVISAVTGVIGVFQSMHQETSLNAIEHNTRYTMMYVGDQGDGGIYAATRGTWMALTDWYAYLGGWYHDAWVELLDGMGEIRTYFANMNEVSAAAATSANDDLLGPLNAIRDLLATVLRDSLNSIDTYAQGIFGIIRDEVSPPLRAIVDALSGGASITVANSAASEAPVATAPLLTQDAAAQLSTANNTLSGISMLLARSLGTVSAQALAPTEVVSPTILSALKDSAQSFVAAMDRAAATVVNGFQSAMANPALAGGPTVNVDLRGSTISNDQAADDLARKITDRLRSIIR